MLPKRMKTCLHKNLTLIAAFLKMVRWQHNSNAHEPVNDKQNVVYPYKRVLFGHKRNEVRDEGTAQVVECLSSKCKALSSNPRSAKKKEMK
jgi:hypothetical protein